MKSLRLNSIFRCLIGLLLVLIVLSPNSWAKPQKPKVKAKPSTSQVNNKPPVAVPSLPPLSPEDKSIVTRWQKEILKRDPSLRGWDYLARKLRADGIKDQEVRAAYHSKLMPRFSFVPFSLQPRETSQMYSIFLSDQKLQLARDFLKQNAAYFSSAEKSFKVDRSIIAALLLIETQFGKNTGKELIVYRLSRVASVRDPQNLIRNFHEQRLKDPQVKAAQIEQRSQYLEDMFYPEIHAFFEIRRMGRLNIFAVRGSIAGAFGMPQFLPSSYLRYAVDANKDKITSLFSPADAIHSTANYLSGSGWKDTASEEEKANVIWKYNHSDAYVNAALEIARLLREK